MPDIFGYKVGQARVTYNTPISKHKNVLVDVFNQILQ